MNSFFVILALRCSLPYATTSGVAYLGATFLLLGRTFRERHSERDRSVPLGIDEIYVFTVFFYVPLDLLISISGPHGVSITLPS